MRMRPILLAALFSALLGGTIGARPLQVRVILDLLGAGVSEPSVRHYVERNHFTVTLTAGDLAALKQAGASDDLVTFLQNREEPQGSGEGSGTADSDVTAAPGDEGQSDGEDSASEQDLDYGVGYDSPAYSYGYYGYGPAYYSPYYYYDPFYYPYSFQFSYYHPYYFGHYGGRTYVPFHSGRTRGVYSQLFPGRTGVRSSSGISSPRSRPGGVASRLRGRGRH
jgi:hypothetical protein